MTTPYEPPTPPACITELGETLAISEERQAQLDLQRKRKSIDHSLTIHRDSTSAADVKLMIAYLQEQGMPDTATLRVDGHSTGHTRMNARWATEAPDA